VPKRTALRRRDRAIEDSYSPALHSAITRTGYLRGVCPARQEHTCSNQIRYKYIIINITSLAGPDPGDPPAPLEETLKISSRRLRTSLLSQYHPMKNDKSKGVNGGSGSCTSRASPAMMARRAPYDAYVIVSIEVVKLTRSLSRTIVASIGRHAIAVPVSFDGDIGSELTGASK
jgi:hypothetical protein